MLSGYEGYVFGIIGFIVFLMLLCRFKKEDK